MRCGIALNNNYRPGESAGALFGFGYGEEHYFYRSASLLINIKLQYAHGSSPQAIYLIPPAKDHHRGTPQNPTPALLFLPHRIHRPVHTPKLLQLLLNIVPIMRLISFRQEKVSRQQKLISSQRQVPSLPSGHWAIGRKSLYQNYFLLLQGSALC